MTVRGGPLHVTHVITRLIVGGAQENTVASVLGLRQHPGLSVNLIAGPTTGPEGSIEHQLQSEPGLLTVLPSLIRPIHPWHDARAWLGLVHHFQQNRPDLVHTHSGKAGFLGRLAAAHARIPLIVHTLHGPSFGPFQNPFANLAFQTAERIAGRVTTHFVAVANSLIRQYLGANIGAPQRYSVIRSGFALQPFLEATPNPNLRQHLQLHTDDFVVGMIARLFKLKGHDDLLAVAPALVRQCPRLRFLLIGDGPWRSRLESRIQQASLTPYFRFAGLVPPDHVPSYVGILDALIHLSRREGLPRALPQALAAGKPILSYDLDGAGEVCLDGQTGFLVRPGDHATLVRRLLQFDRDPALRTRLGLAGQQLVRQQFALERMIDQLHQLYQNLRRPPPTT